MNIKPSIEFIVKLHQYFLSYHNVPSKLQFKIIFHNKPRLLIFRKRNELTTTVTIHKKKKKIQKNDRPSGEGIRGAKSRRINTRERERERLASVVAAALSQ